VLSNDEQKMARQWCAMPLRSRAQPASGAFFWHEQAQELAEQQPGACLMLHQVLISKRKDENSREICSWRRTTILPCSPEMATVLYLSCSACIFFGRLFDFVTLLTLGGAGR